MPNSACFPAVLRRLLCSGDLPTHPSEALNEPNTEAKLVARAVQPGPGVVARLMGLSSLPDPNYRAPGAVSRSKSVNFADYLLHFDSNQAHHRRIRTSASFREVPNPENDFFVLYAKDYFDGYSKRTVLAETEPNFKKLETQRFGGEKQGEEQRNVNEGKKKGKERNECKISKLKDEPRREIGKNVTNSKKFSTSKDSVSVLPSGKYKYKQSVTKNGSAVSSKSIQKKPMKQKEAAIGTELTKDIKKKKSANRHVGQRSEPESDPENSSPVSVLDVRGIAFSDERRMDRIASENRDLDSNGGAGDWSEGYGELVERICRLAEEDIREARWRVKNVEEIEDLEELCMEVERHVVNVLLVQTLDELAYL